jgi:flagellin
MSFKVTANITGVAGNKALSRANAASQNSMKQIATGRRINSASDDAAGLGVAGNLENQHRGTRMAMRAVEDGLSMISVAEGAASSVSGIVMRMRELAVQGSSEVLNGTERAYLQDEFSQLESEINDIAARTVFNTTNLADGTTPSIDVQVGSNNSGSDRVSVSFIDLTLTTVLGGTHDISTTSGSQDSLADLDKGLNVISKARSTLGASVNRLSSVIESSERYGMNMVSAESKISDADYARQSAEMAKSQIIMQSSMAGRTSAQTSAEAVLQMIG